MHPITAIMLVALPLATVVGFLHGLWEALHGHVYERHTVWFEPRERVRIF